MAWDGKKNCKPGQYFQVRCKNNEKITKKEIIYVTQQKH